MAVKTNISAPTTAGHQFSHLQAARSDPRNHHLLMCFAGVCPITANFAVDYVAAVVVVVVVVGGGGVVVVIVVAAAAAAAADAAAAASAAAAAGVAAAAAAVVVAVVYRKTLENQLEQ